MYLHRSLHTQSNSAPQKTQQSTGESLPIKYRIHKFIQSIFDLLNPPSNGNDEGERYLTLDGRTLPLHTGDH